MAKFPIGKSAIPNEIAKSLGYTDKKQYERAARVLIHADGVVRGQIAAMCGDVATLLKEDDVESQP